MTGESKSLMCVIALRYTHSLTHSHAHTRKWTVGIGGGNAGISRENQVRAMDTTTNGRTQTREKINTAFIHTQARSRVRSGIWEIRIPVQLHVRK